MLGTLETNLYVAPRLSGSGGETDAKVEHLTSVEKKGILWALPATVAAIGEKTLSMDCNHPLAGKTLEFDISIEKTGLTPDEPCSPSGCTTCGGSCSD